MIHYSTTNSSFLEMSKNLKRNGIKNNNFMLTLLNPNLEKIDPFDDNPIDIEKAIIEECKNNFWYFIREVVRIPYEDGSINKLTLDKGNMAMFYNSINHIDSWRTKIRHSYATLSVEIFMLYKFLFSNGKEILIGKNSNSLTKQLSKIYTIYSLLPDSILMNYDCIVDNSTLVDKDSIIKCCTAPSDISSAKKTYNEYADIYFYNESEEIQYLLPLINEPTIDKPIDKHYLSNKPLRIFNSAFINNPYKQILNLIKNMFIWKDIFYDTDIEILKNTIMNSSNGIVYIYHNYKELGYSDKWYNNMKELIDDIDLVVREFYPSRS